ncbi:MAG: hypothetical protein JJU40_06865 [Rhodobacteraceae bacterium]|nr:hypothetical protein [Paracoccaceae bacterium]
MSSAARTRILLHDMEAEIGLSDLTDRELRIVYAAVLVSEAGVPFRSDALRNHPLVARMTHPTYHRVLRGLIAKGLIALATPYKAGHYVLRRTAIQMRAGHERVG